MGAALTRVRRLLRARTRRAARRALLEGPHLLEEALRARVALHDVLAVEEDVPSVRALLARHGRTELRVDVVSTEELADVADAETPRGPVVVVDWTVPPDDPLGEPGPWVVLDGVQDPGNVGTLLRSAAAFGATGVVAGRGTADLWSPKVLRAAQGAHFHLATASETAGDVDLAELLQGVVSTGAEVWTTAATGEPLYANDVAVAPRAVVLGNEARGVSDGLRGLATREVSVPQGDGAESLNVGVAGSIVLSWLAWRRGPPR